MPNHLLAGPHYLLAGFRLIFKPQLRRYLYLPLALNFGLFILVLYLSMHYFSVFEHWLSTFLPHWLSWLANLLWVIFFLVFALLVSTIFVTLANLLGAPFHSLLSTGVEEYLSGAKQSKESLAYHLKDLPRMFGRQFLILAYYLPRGLLLFILSFIPGVQLVATPLLFCFNAKFMALQAIDYPTDNHRIPFSQVKSEAQRKYFLVLSFGLSTLFLSWLPLINLFVIPAAVAGATKLWLEEFKSA